MPTALEREAATTAVADAHDRQQQWRCPHPRVTLGEIELDVDRQLAPLRTGLVEQMGHKQPDAMRPRCAARGGRCSG